MKVCDISAHEFLSVRSCGLSGFSLARTSFFLRFGAVLCAISLRKGSCWIGFQCLCTIRLNCVYIVAELCILKIIFSFCVSTFLSRVCGLSLWYL